MKTGDPGSTDHDPSGFDVAATRLLGRTILRPFWDGWIERIGVQSGEVVLDFGSGSGQLSRRLALSVGPKGRLTCLDISGRWLELAREEMSDLPWVDFQLGTLSDVPAAAYDLVHVHYVLHDIPLGFRGSIVAGLAARVRSGGRLAVREPLYYFSLQTAELLAYLGRAGLQLLGRPQRKWWLAGPVVEVVARKVD